MNKFFRWYYQNKNKFWIIVLIIIGSYGLILWFNNYTKVNSKLKNEKANDINSNSIEESILFENKSEEKIFEDANKIIKQFMEYCNNGNVANAYDLISSKCKSEKFPQLEDFINNYYKKIFQTNKIYEIQRWKDTTYQIKFKDNPMTTGKIGDTTYIQDFYIIIYENGNIRLSINNNL